VPRRFEDHGARVLVLGRLLGASRLGEGDLDVSVAWVWTVDAGRIVAMEAFREERTARQAIASHRARR
jgi:ketosteroid isomerase-like protein